jgi:hypothetical protein
MKQQYRSQIYTDLEYDESVYQTVQVYRLLKEKIILDQNITIKAKETFITISSLYDQVLMHKQLMSKYQTDLKAIEEAAKLSPDEIVGLLKDDAQYYVDNIMTCSKHIELVANTIISYMKAIDKHYQNDVVIIQKYISEYVKEQQNKDN